VIGEPPELGEVAQHSRHADPDDHLRSAPHSGVDRAHECRRRRQPTDADEPPRVADGVHHLGRLDEADRLWVVIEARRQVGTEHAVEHAAGDERSTGDQQQGDDELRSRPRSGTPAQLRNDQGERQRGDDQHDVGGDPRRGSFGDVGEQLRRRRHLQSQHDGDQPGDRQPGDAERGEGNRTNAGRARRLGHTRLP